MPHAIRLRGPWEFQPLARFLPAPGGRWEATTAQLPPGGTIQLPADWSGVLGDDFRGTVQFSRTFHKPTGLEANSRVWLVVEDVDSIATVALNDHLYGEIATGGTDVATLLRCPARFDITSDLLSLNRLLITVTSPRLCAGLPIAIIGREGKPGGLIGLVRLEIE